MIQQLRKRNVLATSAMLLTFSASVALVTFITPRKTYIVRCDKTVTLTSEEPSPLDTESAYIRNQPDSPVRLDGFSGMVTYGSTFLSVTNRGNRTVRVFASGSRSKGARRVYNQT